VIGRLIGAVLLVVGVLLALWGYHISQSLSSQLNQLVHGSPSDKAVYLYIAGGICGALGLFKIIK
jgi:drug/metabolite transporter (DMT)-like permease